MHAAASREWLSPAAVLVIAVLLFLSMLELPIVPLIYSLDSSGHTALAYLYSHPRLAGVEWVYTYGPLGAFLWPIYAPDLYWQQLAWEVGVKLTIVVLLVRLVPRAPAAPRPRAIYLVVLAAVVPLAPLDTQYWLAIVAVTVLLIRQEPVRAGWLAAGLVFLAAIAMVKFTLLIFAASGAAAIVLASWMRHARCAAAAGAVTYVAALLAVWFCCGQSLSNIGAYLRTSLELSSGHSQAMSTIGPTAPLAIAIATLALAVPAAVVNARLGESRRVAWIVSGFGGVALLLAWKASFVRQDIWHEMQFFPLAAVLAFVLFRPAAQPRASAWLARARYLWLAVALTGFVAVLLTADLEVDAFPASLVAGRTADAHVTGLAKLGRKLQRNVVDVSLPGAAGRRHDGELAEVRRRLDLPEIRAIVGRQPIDVMSPRLGEALLNDLNWAPRPVFFGAMAYTPALLQFNAERLAGAHAPPFVALAMASVDGRYPTLDDGPALWQLVRRYRPILAEKGYLLFEPSTAPRSDVETPVWQRAVAFGDEVRLPPLRSGTGQRLHVTIEPTALGRTVQAIYRFPPLHMEVTCSDGRRLRFRIIPAMSGSGFLINPRVLDTRELAAWLTGAVPARNLSVRIILAHPADARLVKPVIQMRLVEGDVGP